MLRENLQKAGKVARRKSSASCSENDENNSGQSGTKSKSRELMVKKMEETQMRYNCLKQDLQRLLDEKEDMLKEKEDMNIKVLSMHK